MLGIVHVYLIPAFETRIYIYIFLNSYYCDILCYFFFLSYIISKHNHYINIII